MRVYVESIGLCGPGLEGWAASRQVLADVQEHVPTPTRVPPMPLLPPNERRRAVQTVRLAVAVGVEAFTNSGRDPAGIATVFTSSGGDGETIHEILNVLASPNRDLSPTRFHNSVHNTPAGYWGIGTGSRAPSTSICCHDGSFGAGLLEAATQVRAENDPVTLIAYDVQYPAPLSEVRPIGAPFAVALVLTPVPTARAFASIELLPGSERSAVSPMTSPSLEMLRRTTPAARCLPLLAALARQTDAVITLEYLPDLALRLRVSPVAVDAASGANQPEQVPG
jgi:hypothetical protein